MDWKVFCLATAIVAGLPTVVPSSAWAVDNVTSTNAPDLTSVRAKIKAKDYQGALAELRRLAASNQHADIYNLMGFCLRKTGDREQAFVYYRKALDFDPNHKGALEYQGELFVETGQMDKAKQNLARLKTLCLFGCEELSDLQEAINAAAKGS